MLKRAREAEKLFGGASARDTMRFHSILKPTVRLCESFFARNLAQLAEVALMNNLAMQIQKRERALDYIRFFVTRACDGRERQLSLARLYSTKSNWRLFDCRARRSRKAYESLLDILTHLANNIQKCGS